MSELNEILVSGSDFGQFAESLTAAIQALSRESSNRLRRIQTEYFTRFGFEGAQRRLNNRTVGQIFDEYEPMGEAIAEGERDGITFRLDQPTCPDPANRDKPREN